MTVRREIAEPRRETGTRSPEDPMRTLAIQRGSEGRARRPKACRSSRSTIGGESVMNHAGEVQRTRHMMPRVSVTRRLPRGGPQHFPPNVQRPRLDHPRPRDRGYEPLGCYGRSRGIHPPCTEALCLEQPST
jgi:hypothetical protein